MQENTYAMNPYGIMRALDDARISDYDAKLIATVWTSLDKGEVAGVIGDSGIEVKFVPVIGEPTHCRTYKIYRS